MSKPHNKKRKYFLITIALLLAIALAATIFLPYVVDINNYRGFIVKKAEELLNRRVSIEEIQLHLINGIGIRCVGVRIGDASGQGEFIRADDMLVKFKPIPLLRKELVINKIILERPRINIERDSQGRFSFQPPEAPPEKEKGEEEGIEWSLSRLLIDKIIIRQGQARLIDRAVNEQGLLTKIKELNLTLKEFELGQPFALTLSARLDQGKNRASYIALSAQVAGLDRGMIDPARIRLKAQAKIRNWDLSAFSTYYKDYLPWDNLTGLADIELDYQGNLADEFRLEARVKLKSAWLTYSALFTPPLPFPTGQAQLAVTLRDNRLDTQIKSFKLDCGRFSISGRLYLADFLSPQRSINLQAAYSPFAIEDSKRYIPFRVIPPKVADFINNSVSAGTVEGLSVKLAGELRQFEELDKPENYALLSAAAKFSDLTLVLTDPDYKLVGVSGSVDLSEGRLVFDELTASIESSRIKIYNSRISDLYSTPRFEFNSTSSLSLTDNYLKGGLPAGLTGRLNPQGTANLRLQARGDSQKLAVEGVVDLSQVSYSYGSWLKKGIGQSNSLEFNAQLLNWKTAELQRLIYSLGASQVFINVEELKPVKLDLQTDRFDIQDLKPLMPNLFTSDTRGLIMADVRAVQSPAGVSISGNMAVRQSRLGLVEYSPKLEGESQLQFNISAKPDGLLIAGEADLTQTAYAYKDWLSKPLGLKNSVVFQGLLKDTGRLQLERLVVSLDSSQVMVNGWINELKSLESELKLTGEGIDVNHITPLIANLLPNGLTVDSGQLNLALGLSGRLNDPSQLDIQGVIQVYNARVSGEDPPYQLDILSARLNPLNDSLRLDLQGGQGSYQKFSFSQLISQAKLNKSQLLIDKLSLAAYQGSLSLKGRLNLPLTPHRYDLSFTAENMDIKKLGLTEGVISGRISANGQLSNTDKGENKFAGLNGVLKLKLTDGEIKKYGTLAKIFSLISLNGRTPDFSSEGFPYQSIQGSFNITNGVAATDNLTLASNAWRIVTLGQIDMVNQQLDLKVYVQPWQTLDKLISRIPIAGKILKGEKRGVIDTYFIIKGDLASPEVTAKPFTSLGENIWGIFKRTLSLPFTIFSD